METTLNSAPTLKVAVLKIAARPWDPRGRRPRAFREGELEREPGK